MSVLDVRDKECTKCRFTKPLKDFPVASVNKDGRAGECKTCKAIRTKKQYDERCEMLLRQFNYSCGDCGLIDKRPSFFDFHHIIKETKTSEVKSIINGSIEKLQEEANKCVMLCPNCHRERHLKEGW